jgi:hypothetical protein
MRKPTLLKQEQTSIGTEAPRPTIQHHTTEGKKSFANVRVPADSTNSSKISANHRELTLRLSHCHPYYHHRTCHTHKHARTQSRGKVGRRTCKVYAASRDIVRGERRTKNKQKEWFSGTTEFYSNGDRLVFFLANGKIKGHDWT